MSAVMFLLHERMPVAFHWPQLCTGTHVQLAMQPCAVCVPVAFLTHMPTEASQLYVGALHAATQACAVCVPSASAAHWPVLVLQLYVGALHECTQSSARCVPLLLNLHWPVVGLQL